MNEKNWSPLDHQIYRELNSLKLTEKKCLLMVSGGADSVALLKVFQKLESALNLKIEVLHCHHGPAATAQEKYRDQALLFVESLCQKEKLPFHKQVSSECLKSEEEMREFRLRSARKIQIENNFDWIVWAHHRDDLLETQILRLIRGSSPQTIFEPMSLARDQMLRPFLQISRGEIISYLKNQNLEWLEDPSNQDESYLRNWLRNNWLPQLEAKCPGALNAFSRSLGLIRESLDETISEEIWIEGGISRPLFLTLSEAQKKQVLAKYLRQLGQKEFTHNQLKEILKHLDISQLNHTFKAAQLVWSLEKDLISAKAAFVVNAF